LYTVPGHNHRDNRILSALPADVLSVMERDLRQVTLGPGTIIFEPGDPVDQIYFPQTGMISLVVVTAHGATVEISTVGREGAVGLHRALGERRSFTRATAQVAGYFSIITAARFEHAIKGNASVRDLILRYTELLWAEAQQTAACNAVHDASSRLCRWLLQTADRLDSDMLPLTQEFLSQMLGVRRTTLTLLARDLQIKGAIRYTRGKIKIINRAALEASACECYQVIRQDALPPRIGVSLEPRH
jgi:CRP-like cAMP-binding protein